MIFQQPKIDQNCREFRIRHFAILLLSRSRFSSNQHLKKLRDFTVVSATIFG